MALKIAEHKKWHVVHAVKAEVFKRVKRCRAPTAAHAAAQNET